MRQVGIIKSIYRFPVKSMAGEELVSAELGWHGIKGDRRFAFVRTGNMSGMPWLTASKMPELVRYHAYHSAVNGEPSPSVRVRTPDGNDVQVEDEELRQKVMGTFGAEVTLIRVGNGIFDDAPISLISTTMIKKLEADSGCRLDPRRFRANLLIEPFDTVAVDEDGWLGKTVVLGGHAHSPAVRVTVRDIRCTMVNLDPETAAADPRVLKTIAHTQDNCAGVYASVFEIGTIAAGDGVYLKEER